MNAFTSVVGKAYNRQTLRNGGRAQVYILSVGAKFAINLDAVVRAKRECVTSLIGGCRRHARELLELGCAVPRAFAVQIPRLNLWFGPWQRRTPSGA